MLHSLWDSIIVIVAFFLLEVEELVVLEEGLELDMLVSLSQSWIVGIVLCRSELGHKIDDIIETQLAHPVVELSRVWDDLQLHLQHRNCIVANQTNVVRGKDDHVGEVKVCIVFLELVNKWVFRVLILLVELGLEHVKLFHLLICFKQGLLFYFLNLLWCLLVELVRLPPPGLHTLRLIRSPGHVHREDVVKLLHWPVLWHLYRTDLNRLAWALFDE
jgi:hypothetical protein